jgi:pyruvate/2-oxoglutarate dehydrogenase complex dihydrolipoamide acyltransferase (E2) component
MPFARRFVIDSMIVGESKHVIHGLLEVDVTTARERIARSERDLSFSAYVVACLARSIAAHPIVHAYRSLRGDLVIFDDVDVCVIVETERSQHSSPIPVVLRGAESRTVADLTDEIRRAQRSARPMGRSRFRLAGYLPGLVRRAVMRLAMKNPSVLKKQAGTAAVTSVGMFGNSPGYGIAHATVHTLGLVVGSITRHHVLGENGRTVARERLQLTVSVDHDIVDGGPAARFTADLVAALESGDLLRPT